MAASTIEHLQREHLRQIDLALRARYLQREHLRQIDLTLRARYLQREHLQPVDLSSPTDVNLSLTVEQLQQDDPISNS